MSDGDRAIENAIEDYLDEIMEGFELSREEAKLILADAMRDTDLFLYIEEKMAERAAQ